MNLEGINRLIYRFVDTLFLTYFNPDSETILPVTYYMCYHLYAKVQCVCSFILVIH